MIRNRSIQKAAALLLSLPLMLLGGASLSARDGLADDGSKPGGKDKDADAAKDAVAPAPVPAPAPAPAPARKAAPAAKAPARRPAPAARNAPPPGDDNRLDREILDALGQGPGGGPNFFQGQITINGQTQRFGNQQGFNNAMGPMPRMGFPAPGMPGNGMNAPGMVPGMPFNRFQGNFLAPALRGTRAVPRRNATATPKRRTTVTKKATPNPAAPRQKPAPAAPAPAPPPPPVPAQPG